MRKLISLVMFTLLLGCAPLSGPAGELPASGVGNVDYSCATDADCEVKDVGNCCGYYPACVNKQSPTFAEQIRRDCAKTGSAGICGFPSVEGCRCVAKRCTNAGSSGELL